jgi:ATP-dependent DNA helicase PIF1
MQMKRSYLWKHFEVFKLTQNMHLSCMTDNQNEQQKIKEFVEWILNIGDGETTTDDAYELIQVPDDLLLQKGDDAKDTIVHSTYPDLISNYIEGDYLQERAILCPTNDTTEQISEYKMNKLQGEEVTYLSSYSVCSASTNGLDNMYPMEFMNT